MIFDVIDQDLCNQTFNRNMNREMNPPDSQKIQLYENLNEITDEI